MTRECHVRFCESAGVRSPRGTHLDLKIDGRMVYLWRAVDAEGEVLDVLVQSCVQRRLACSAGERPAGAKVRRPVVWIAGWRETKTLKPIDNVSLGETTSRRAVMKVNANVASKKLAPKAEPTTGGRRQHGEPKSDRSGSFTSAGWKRQHGGKDMPSNWRSPPRPGAKSPEQGRSYNRRSREVDRRREGGGRVRSSGEAE